MVKDVGIVSEDNEMIRCEVCGEDLYEWECGNSCWYCEQDANEPIYYGDDSLNEVNMGRFDDDPPEHM
tara:strand:- start:665 stop:868 length:204 start_codon:yes stop_codon:yes gene_type:complete